VIRTHRRAKILKTYNRGKRLVFSPEIEREMLSPKPRTRYQAKRLPKEAVSEKQVQIEAMIELHRDRDDSPFQHHEEVPLGIEMADLGE